MAKEPSVWIIAIINHKHIHGLFADLLKKPKYRLVRYYIPTVQVVTKQVKGKKFFEDVPILLNYGFFKVPRYFVPNPYFLLEMKKDIRCIFNWLNDPVRSTEKKTLTYDTLYNPLGVAITTPKAIRQIKKQQEKQTIYTDKDIDTLYEGKIIELKGYPFEGIPAEIKVIDTNGKKVNVRLLIETPLLTQSRVWVSFENIFFTKYMEDYVDGPMREQSLEEMEVRNRSKKNKLMKDGDSE